MTEEKTRFTAAEKTLESLVVRKQYVISWYDPIKERGRKQIVEDWSAKKALVKLLNSKDDFFPQTLKVIQILPCDSSKNEGIASTLVKQARKPSAAQRKARRAYVQRGLRLQ